MGVYRVPSWNTVLLNLSNCLALSAWSSHLLWMIESRTPFFFGGGGGLRAQGKVSGLGFTSMYIYIYICSPPPPMIHTFGLGKAGFGRGGTPDSRFPENIWSTPRLQTPDFQKKSGVPPDSRLQISRKNLEYHQTPDSRFPEKNLEYRDPGLQILESVIWSLGPRVLQIFSGNLESGVWGPRVLQIFSGNLESGVWGRGYSRFFLEISRLQTPDFQKKSGVPPDSRLQISRKNLEYHQTPDSRFPEKIWSTGTLDSRFWSL